MSIRHYLKPQKKYDLNVITNNLLDIENLKFEFVEPDLIYFWINKYSTRGVYLKFSKSRIEVTNYLLSNEVDYNLTNYIVKLFEKYCECKIFDEDHRLIQRKELYNDDTIDQYIRNDARVIRVLMENNEDIAIEANCRKVHFGRRLFQENKNLNDDQFIKFVFDTILNVNYRLPDYQISTSVIQVTRNDETKNMKAISNDGDWIINKYDNLIFIDSDESIIMITNQILNMILPNEWSLVDEFTIVAPQVSDASWAELIERARKYNLLNDSENKK